VEAGSATIWASVHRPGGGARLDRSRTVVFDEDGRGAALSGAAADLAADLLASGAADLAPIGAPA
jgi:hypothetical protein